MSLLAWPFPEIMTHVGPRGNYSPGIGERPLPNFTRPVIGGGVATAPVGGVVTEDRPMKEREAAVFGAYGLTFSADYYNRVHVVPGQLTLGNLLSAQVRLVEVWNAYFTPNLLSSVDEVGTDGITFIQPQTPPTSYAELESRIHEVQVNTNGPPVINAVYTFNFETEAPTLSITGRRVVIWPFIPETGHDETLEWKTDIIPTFKAEQRLALRHEPRQAFRHQFLLDPDQFSRAKSMATQWAHRVYGIAVWAEASLVRGLSAGAEFVEFPTAFADYREGDLILLWENDRKLEALEITTVEPDGVNLRLPLEQDWNKCYVMPLRFARTLSGVEFSRSHNEYVVARALFDVSQNADLGDNLDFPTYRGKPVLTDRSATVGNIRERIARTIDVFDNGSGPISVDVDNDWVRNAQTIAFVKNTREDIWDLRRWVHARRGRQRAFWLPSWNKDLEVLQNIGEAGTAITVNPIGYPLYYDVKDIMVQLKNGAQHFRRVTSGSTDPDGNEALILDAPFGVEIFVEDIAFVCFMTHCRFDADRITFRHQTGGRVTTTIPVIETPEEAE